jgi:hypothetical protein
MCAFDACRLADFTAHLSQVGLTLFFFEVGGKCIIQTKFPNERTKITLKRDHIRMRIAMSLSRKIFSPRPQAFDSLPKLNTPHLLLLRFISLVSYCFLFVAQTETFDDSDDGEVYVWGRNRLGLLGLGERGETVATENETISAHLLSPTLMATLKTERIVMVSCGSYHSCALSGQCI